MVILIGMLVLIVGLVPVGMLVLMVGRLVPVGMLLFIVGMLVLIVVHGLLISLPSFNNVGRGISDGIGHGDTEKGESEDG